MAKHDYWKKAYTPGGRRWGDEPGECAEFLIKHLAPASSVLDLGCGYGRHSKALLREGHKVVCMDKSPTATAEAHTVLQQYINRRSAQILNKDIITTEILKKKFDAVLSHRTLHLPDPKVVPLIIKKLASSLKPSGLIVLTARSHEDFDPNQMKRIDEDTAVYKDRPFHKINFYDEERFKQLLSEYFTDLSFSVGKEIESVGNLDEKGVPIQSKFIQVTGKKKTAEHLLHDQKRAKNKIISLEPA